MSPAGKGRRRAKRSLGQNFLIDPNLQRKIAGAAGTPTGEGASVLEIGPGHGALTRHLVGSGATVTAVELDDELAAALTVRYQDDPRVTIMHDDILSVELSSLTADWGRTRVVGNIPYNITTPIIFRLLQLPYPADIVLTVQAEVAARIMSGPGTRVYGALSVGVAIHARVERVCKVPRQAFRPVPRVDSIAIRVTPRDPPRVTADEAARVRTLTRAAFSWRRKQLGTILRRHPDLRCPASSIRDALTARPLSPTVRPEQLSPEDFLWLTNALTLPAQRF